MQDIIRRYEEKIEAARAQYDVELGTIRDHPASEETRKLERARNAELRELQREYSYLFTLSGGGGDNRV